MECLHGHHPWLHKQFVNGFHAVRRENRHWAGLWSYLLIEQTLMQSVKTRGGLTRGRGMSQAVHHIWVLSLNHCAAVHDAMSSLSGLIVKSSEQHVDMGISRQKRDLEDCTLFIVV